MEAINTSSIVYPYYSRHLGLFLVEGEALQYHHNKAYGNDDSKFNEGVLTYLIYMLKNELSNQRSRPHDPMHLPKIKCFNCKGPHMTGECPIKHGGFTQIAN